MDERYTLSAKEKFDAIIREIMKNNEKAHFIVDNKGLERASGIISSANLGEAMPNVILDNGQKILLDSIVGVNGVFRDDFSTC